MNALHGVSVITPTNLLVDQFIAEFPDTPSLHRLDSYHCETWDRPCPITRSKLLEFCKRSKDCTGCPASRDLSTAKYRRGPGIYNYYTYLAHKLYRPVLVVDEAHNLIPVIRDREAQVIWQHDYRYPSNMYSTTQYQTWLATLTSRQLEHKKIRLLRQSLGRDVPQFIPQRTMESFNGKGTLRGQPEDRDCIKLLPVDITEAPPMFWPKEVEKVILLSATIGPKDIEALGLGGRGRRVCYIDCKSPIPHTNRPIIPLDVVSVNRNNMEAAVPLLGQEILAIADYHSSEKGVVHCTYQLARDLIPLLSSNSRFLFHDKSNKREQYQLFRDSSEPRILVACGMYEGIDLPEDLGRWQVIAKIPWPSLANPGLAHLAERDPEWYNWETCKTTIQACGRICRTPEDFGVSYVLDSTFRRLVSEARHMLPDWWLDALVDSINVSE